MEKLFIVVYADNSVMLFTNRQRAGSHQMRAVQFETSGDTTVSQLRDWMGSDGLDISRIHSTPWT